MAFAFNRRLFQTVQAADETGGVCCPECGDNQHGQSSLVSSSEIGEKCTNIKDSISVCVNSPVWAVLMVETLTLHQGDLPWDPGQPFYSVSVPPPASCRRG